MYKILSNSYYVLKNIRNLDSFCVTCVSPVIRCNSHSTKEILASDRVPQSGSQDILLKNIKSATDTSDLLMSVKLHLPIMNNRHLMQAFKSIFLLQKAEHSLMSNGEVSRSQEFKLLCQALKSQVRILDIDDRIDALKTLSFLGVPATSKIVQILLQTMTKDVNDLSLQQIAFFDFLIKDFESCPLVNALHIALPIVFEANLKTKVDSDSLQNLTELLHYATRKNLSSASLFLIGLLMRKRSEIDFKCARSVVRSICDLTTRDVRHRLLLHQALDVVVDNETKCTYQDYDLLMSKMVAKYSSKYNYYYHEEFMNSATKFIINNDAGFNEGVWLLRKSTKYGYVSFELLDYLMRKAEIDPQLIENGSTFVLFSIVNGLAQADYRPSNWNSFESLIVKNARSHMNHVELPWTKFARDLCILDIWPFEIFQKIFSDEFLNKFLAREYNMLDYLQLIALYQAVKTLCPNYKGPWPPDHFIEKGVAFNGSHITDFPLAGALAQGLGGRRYVLNGVHTKLGHFIDHIVIMRKGEYPVPFTDIKGNSQKIFVEDLQKTDECQTIAILYLPPSSFTINTGKIKGSTRLMINSLEASGLSVVFTDSSSWEQLLDSEKIPYIMNLIKTNSLP